MTIFGHYKESSPEVAIFCDGCQTKVFSYLFVERIEIPVSFSHSPAAVTNADLNFVSLS